MQKAIKNFNIFDFKNTGYIKTKLLLQTISSL